MSNDTIVPGDPGYEQLYTVWLQEKKPGYVTLPNGSMYRVLQPSDDDIRFAPVQGGVDGLYQSSSAKTIGGQR